jgi:transcriptional regulator
VNAKQEHNETEDEEDAEETLAGTQSNISSARKEANENLQKQAKRMKLISDATHPPVDVGGNVIIPIADVDRAKADLRNIVAVVLDNMKTVCTRSGRRMAWRISCIAGRFIEF